MHSNHCLFVGKKPIKEVLSTPELCVVGWAKIRIKVSMPYHNSWQAVSIKVKTILR